METPNWLSCATVLRTTELLENILSFLDIQDLLEAREVSYQWRSVAEWSLKRRLYARTEQRWYGFNISLWEETETSFHLDLRKLEPRRYAPTAPSSKPPHPITADLSSEEIIFHIGPAPALRPGRSKRYPAVLSTLLKFDWCAGIQQLSLSGRTVSIQEWNFIGRYLLNCFQRLKYLELVLWSAAEGISSEWKNLNAHASEVHFRSEVEDIEILYVQQNQRYETSHLELEFLQVCPKLHSLDLRFATKDSELGNEGPRCSLSCRFFEAKVDSKIQVDGSQETMTNWMNEVDSHLRLLKPSALSFEIDQHDYIARLPKAAASNLEKLKVAMNLVEDKAFNGRAIFQSLSRIPALSSVTSLTLSIWASTFFEGSGGQFPLLGEIASRNGLAENCLSNVTRLNLERLDPGCFCKRPEMWLGRCTAEMWEIVPKVMPNIELLLIHMQCLCFLESVCDFERLKHLVILNPSVWTVRMPDPPKAAIWRKFKTLQTVTAHFKLWTEHDDETSTQRNLLTAMAQAPSMRVIRIFHPSRTPAVVTQAEVRADLAALVPGHVRIEIHTAECIQPDKITLENFNQLSQQS